MFQTFIRRCLLVCVAVFVPVITAQPNQTLAAAANAACSVANSNATILSAYPLDYPTIARAENASGTSVVQVTLGANGDVTDAALKKTSGSTALDLAAIRAVLNSHFAAQVADCTSIGGTYLVEVDWE